MNLKTRKGPCEMISNRAWPYVLAVALATYSPIVMAQATPDLPVAPRAMSIDDRGVDLMTDTLALQDPSVSIGNPNDGGLSYIRQWRGKEVIGFGGWTNNYLYYLTDILIPDFMSYTTVSRGGKSTKFQLTVNTNGAWGPPFRNRDMDGASLDKSTSGGYTFTEKDGSVIYFTAINAQNNALATLMVRPNGERITWTYDTTTFKTASYSFPNVKRLISVQSNFGYQIKFEHPSGRLDISKAIAINDAVDYCSPSASSCAVLPNLWPSETFSRPNPDTSSPITETVTSALGRPRSFSIAGYVSYLVSRVPGPVGTPSINYTYRLMVPWPITGYNFPEVSSISDPSGVWSYTTDRMPLGGPSSNNHPFHMTRTSPSGKVVIYTNDDYNYNYPKLASVKDELNYTTNYQYDTLARLTHVIPPEGSVTAGSPPTAGYVQNVYDDRGNVTSVTKVAKSGSSLPNVIYQADFDAACTNVVTCNKPNWVKDGLGNQTDYTYDATHGGILSELKAAPSAGQARPLTLTTWVQIAGWTKNASGTLVQSAYPIWRVSTKTECQTVAGSSSPVCDASAPQTVTTYQYGASGTRYALLVKGVAVSSGGATLRTCYDYDIYDRRISETKPNASLGVCP